MGEPRVRVVFHLPIVMQQSQCLGPARRGRWVGAETVDLASSVPLAELVAAVGQWSLHETAAHAEQLRSLLRHCVLELPADHVAREIAVDPGVPHVVVLRALGRLAVPLAELAVPAPLWSALAPRALGR